MPSQCNLSIKRSPTPAREGLQAHRSSGGRLRLLSPLAKFLIVVSRTCVSTGTDDLQSPCRICFMRRRPFRLLFRRAIMLPFLLRVEAHAVRGRTSQHDTSHCTPLAREQRGLHGSGRRSATPWYNQEQDRWPRYTSFLKVHPLFCGSASLLTKNSDYYH